MDGGKGVRQRSHLKLKKQNKSKQTPFLQSCCIALLKLHYWKSKWWCLQVCSLACCCCELFLCCPFFQLRVPSEMSLG